MKCPKCRQTMYVVTSVKSGKKVKTYYCSHCFNEVPYTPTTENEVIKNEK